MRMLRILAICCFTLTAALGLQPVQAQPGQTTVEYTAAPQSTDIEMADALRQDGKIYVVIVVLLTVLVGVLFYLIALDRKVGKLEKQLKDEFVNR